MKNIAHTAVRLAAATLLSGSLLAPTFAEDKLLDAEQCIRMTSIDRTRVVDESNILFYMKGGDIYLNRLPHPCPGLRSRDPFMYRTSLNQLCNVDIITVLQNIGFGYSPGMSCGLGMFYPLDELSAQELLNGETP